MRAIELRDRFGTDNLHLVDRPDPTPGPGQVLLRVRAASLNYRDWLMVQGQYNPRQPLPLVPCSDGAGEILAVGEGVDRVAPGDRVATCFAQGWLAGEHDPRWLGSTLGGPLDGTLRELMVLDQDGVVPVPAHLSDAQAATLPCAALTAWTTLEAGGVRAGDTVLVLGTGGVSIAALQLAQARGARVIVSSSSADKRARAEALGAWKTFDYRAEPKWGRLVRKLTGGRGVDTVVEVGGAGTLEQSLSAVRFGGTVGVIGILAGAAQPLSVLPILMRAIKVQGIFVGHRAGFEAMNRAIDAAGIEPVVDVGFPLDQAAAAFTHLGSGAHFGKVVITL